MRARPVNTATLVYTAAFVAPVAAKIRAYFPMVPNGRFVCVSKHVLPLIVRLNEFAIRRQARATLPLIYLLRRDTFFGPASFGSDILTASSR
jgi:hypothetical protein